MRDLPNLKPIFVRKDPETGVELFVYEIKIKSKQWMVARSIYCEGDDFVEHISFSHAEPWNISIPSLTQAKAVKDYFFKPEEKCSITFPNPDEPVTPSKNNCVHIIHKRPVCVNGKINL